MQSVQEEGGVARVSL